MHITGKAAAGPAGRRATSRSTRTPSPTIPKSRFVTSGVRIGTPCATTRGLGVAEMDRIAACIYDGSRRISTPRQTKFAPPSPKSALLTPCINKPNFLLIAPPGPSPAARFAPQDLYFPTGTGIIRENPTVLLPLQNTARCRQGQCRKDCAFAYNTAKYHESRHLFLSA